MSAETSWNDEPDLDEETAARLDRFLQAGKAETQRLLDESVDVEQKLAESLERLATDDSEDASWPQPLLKWHRTA
ncbi:MULTISPECIES: hypothetical protein [Streptomyces]|uniref:Uncharacterized protein n=1 Tax=Streptomyces chartreusis NRRL 3882 TaxID=1079985 RepID=A0A2N9AZU7_STRCX|nr:MULTISPECIES: hypothetical protein [Streptomyces]MYS95604.1 hypothetical protein [Streptomyces sp. SID5464]SOR76591.1 hypothetical protein SCNRRL3882_0075 [Streptomyces chartreusis NRRL 3882]